MTPKRCVTEVDTLGIVDTLAGSIHDWSKSIRIDSLFQLNISIHSSPLTFDPSTSPEHTGNGRPSLPLEQLRIDPHSSALNCAHLPKGVTATFLLASTPRLSAPPSSSLGRTNTGSPTHHLLIVRCTRLKGPLSSVTLGTVDALAGSGSIIRPQGRLINSTRCSTIALASSPPYDGNHHHSEGSPPIYLQSSILGIISAVTISRATETISSPDGKRRNVRS